LAVPEKPYTSQDVLVYSRTVKFLPNTDVSACESNSNAADSPTLVVLVRWTELIFRSLVWIDDMNNTCPPFWRLLWLELTELTEQFASQQPLLYTCCFFYYGCSDCSCPPSSHSHHYRQLSGSSFSFATHMIAVRLPFRR
jgi:hypothetical protein